MKESTKLLAKLISFMNFYFDYLVLRFGYYFEEQDPNPHNIQLPWGPWPPCKKQIRTDSTPTPRNRKGLVLKPSPNELLSKFWY